MWNKVCPGGSASLNLLPVLPKQDDLKGSTERAWFLQKNRKQDPFLRHSPALSGAPSKPLMASRPRSRSLLPPKDVPVMGTSAMNPSLDTAVNLAGYREASLEVNWRPKRCGVNLGGFEENKEDTASRGGTPPHHHKISSDSTSISHLTGKADFRVRSSLQGCSKGRAIGSQHLPPNMHIQERSPQHPAPPALPWTATCHRIFPVGLLSLKPQHQ